MDSLKAIDKRPWIHNEKIKVSEFLDLWRSVDLDLELSLTQKTIDQQFSRMFATPIDHETIDSLKEDISIDSLTNDCDKDWKDFLYGNRFAPPYHVKLNAVAAQVAHVEKFDSDAKYRNYASQLLKNRNYTFLNNPEVKRPSTSNEPRITDLDVLLTVQIYTPMHSTLYMGDHRKHINPTAEQEFLCLGNQFLTDLKDEIICPVDACPAEDCSDDPSTSKPSAGDIYTSSFFFINDCFYNDLRESINIDISQVIMDWAKNPERGIGVLETAKMEETRFADLTIRLGQPYVFVHQGNCEHMVVFTEMRLFSPQTDSPFLCDYPRLFKTVRKFARRCNMCHTNVAKWTVFENKRLPHEPFFFCEKCFQTFNYDSNNQKIGHFKAFPYLDKSAIL